MMIPPPSEPIKIKIVRSTFLGENENLDKEFFEYLEFMGISHSVAGPEEDIEWPLVEYEGTPHDLKTMLSSRFGMDLESMKEEYPELFSQ